MSVWYGSNKPKTTVKIAAMDATAATNASDILSTLPGLTVNGGVIADAAAIPANTSAQYQIITAAAETNTLAIPATRGLVISLMCEVYAVGDRVVTVASAINQATNTVMTFGAVGDWITLVAVDIGGTLYWRVLANDGVALT